MLLEGSKAQSTHVVAHSRSRAKVWLIFWSYQDESILKMKGTSSSKWRALIKVFDKDQKCLSPFMEFIAFFCQSSPTGPSFPENSKFFIVPWRKYFKGTSNKKTIPICGATSLSKTNWSKPISTKDTNSAGSNEYQVVSFDRWYLRDLKEELAH